MGPHEDGTSARKDSGEPKRIETKDHTEPGRAYRRLLLAVALVRSLVLVGHRSPGVVGIEQLHFAEFIEGFNSEILLVDDAVVTNNEGLHASDVIFSGRRNQRE